jgi:hypothetical protein
LSPKRQFRRIPAACGPLRACLKRRGDARASASGSSIVMEAIGVILLFVAAFGLLNRIEFGRFD